QPLGFRAMSMPSPRRTRRLAMAGVALTSSLILLAACSGGSSGSSANGKGGATAGNQGIGLIPSGRSTQGSSGATTGTQPSTTAGQGLPADPLTYGKALFDAWRTANQPEAGRYATAPAITTLFAQTYARTDDWQGPTCQGMNGTSTCTWMAKSGRKLQVELRNSDLGNPMAVTQVKFANK
ncbi:MAG: hypothetical protein ACR2G7_07590, partial [Acidimicrobiales bacterium]